jgi:threonine 3-dehydrogenase
VHALTRSGLRAGDSTAVLGCGPIGLFIISLLRISGAAEIIATDVSPYRLDLARRVGATITVNAAREEVLRVVKDATRGIGPNIVFEASGNSSALVQAFEMVAKRGKLMLVAGHASTPALNFTQNVHLKEASLEGIYGREIWATWDRATELLRRRMIDIKPIITHRFPLERMDDAIATAKKAEAGKILVIP